MIMGLSTVLGLALFCLGNACVTLKCVDFGDNTCASIDGSTINLRSEDCASLTYCSIADAVALGPGQVSLNCSQIQNSSNTYDQLDYRSCGTRLLGRNLASGNYPKTCGSVADCSLVDGSLNDCQCGYDGNMYCVPDINSRVFNQYWQLCSENGNQIYRNDYYYWTWYLNHYTLITSAPSCAWSVSIELLTFRYLDAFTYQNSGVFVSITLGLLGFWGI